jgi:hypothetical protein
VTPQVDAITLRLSATELALFFFGRTGRPWLDWENWDGGEGIRLASLPVRQPNECLPKKAARMGDEGKAVGCVTPTALLSVVPSTLRRHPIGWPIFASLNLALNQVC